MSELFPESPKGIVDSTDIVRINFLKKDNLYDNEVLSQNYINVTRTFISRSDEPIFPSRI